MQPDWPFVDAPQTATLVSRFVLEGEPICYVYRDWEDGMWQFLPNRVTQESDAKLVCLREIYDLDQSIVRLADLPHGWMAYRSDVSSPWEKKKHHPFPEFQDDGFYLDDATEYQRLFPDTCRIPSEELRENLAAGDTVILIFRFADEWSPRADNQCERMWVEVSEVDAENLCYRGTLLNDPLLHGVIACGHQLWFHPIHVFDIHNEANG